MPCWGIDLSMNRSPIHHRLCWAGPAGLGRAGGGRGRPWTRLKSSLLKSALLKLALVISTLAGWSVKVEAQDGAATVPPPAAVRRPNAARPPQPVESTPVDYFRQLLAAKGEDRERLLATRPAAQHAQFRAILQEYERCTPEERERRLQALELRYRITATLRLAPAARTQAVARLSESVRPLVQDRLNYWNQLAPDVQRDLLANERLMRIVTSVSLGRTAAIGTALSSNELGRVEAAVRDWNNLPEGKRVAAEDAFRKVFESGSARSVEGKAWTEMEQDEIRRALARFKHLSPVQRSICIRNVPKLAGMSPAERAEFLRSAEEWREMTAEERQAWKNMVKRSPVLPPFPPGFRTQPPLPFRMPMFIPAVQTAKDTNATDR